MALHLFARFHARPGTAAALEAAIREVGGPTRSDPGCLSWQAFRSVRVTDEFRVHSTWTDRASFEHHAALPHTVRFLAAVTATIDHPLDVGLADPLE
jgi:quinol monooxygenase YgiN